MAGVRYRNKQSRQVCSITRSRDHSQICQKPSLEPPFSA